MDDAVTQAVRQFGIQEVTDIRGSTNVREGKPNSSWYVNGRYVLKAFTDLDSLRRVLMVNSHLRQENVPAARYSQTTSGESYAAVQGTFYTLAGILPGSHAELCGGDFRKRFYSFGGSAARLHLALKGLEGKVACWNADAMEEFHGWILPEITAKKIPLRREILDCCAGFDALYHQLPRQVIHRDLHLGNVLFENDEVSGFLDFDICQRNARLFDLCYFGSSVLPARKTEEEMARWRELFSGFLAGYHAVSPLLERELIAIPNLSVFIGVLFAAFWSREGRGDKVPLNVQETEWSYDNREWYVFRAYSKSRF